MGLLEIINLDESPSFWRTSRPPAKIEAGKLAPRFPALFIITVKNMQQINSGGFQLESPDTI